MPEYGIDASYHNGSINWPDVRADGISFATIKATSGESSGGTDSPAYFRAQAPKMAGAIPLCGGYHWLKPRTVASAKVQVSTFVDVVGDALGGYEGRLIQLDVEEGGPSDVRAWMDEWNHVTNGYPVAGYLPRWLEGQWANSTLSTYGFAAWWSSMYLTGNGQPYRSVATRVPTSFWADYDGMTTALLQFTSTAHVNGVGGLCDVNIYRGTLPQLGALLTRGEDDMTPDQDTLLREVHKMLMRGERLNEPQTSGGGKPLVWLARAFQELGVDIAEDHAAVMAEVDGVEEAGAQILAEMRAGAGAGIDPEYFADLIATRLKPAEQAAIRDAIREATPEQVQALLDAMSARLTG